MELIVIVVVLLAALLGLTYFFLRNPGLERRARRLESENRDYRALVADIRQRAVSSADVDPVSQVTLDMINNTEERIGQ